MLPFKKNSADYPNQLPIELCLKGFIQAKIVLTDSFHACVFSIIFHKQFYLYANNDRGMERYSSLFNTLGINNRIVKSIDDTNKIPDINYDIVHKRITMLQNKSLNYLLNALH